MDGLRQADSAGGEFILSMYGSAGRAPRNSFTHFYNPLTKEGFVFPIPSTQGLTLSPDPHLLMQTRWEVSLMMGPMPSAVDSINWEYAKAVAALRDSDRIASFVALGRALHILQDVTVPHHSTDKPAGLPGTKHTEYEALCEALLKNATLGLRDVIHPTAGGIYCDTCPPSEFVETAANQSARFIAAATQPGTEQAEAVAKVLLGAADKLTAGLMHRFIAQWQAEPFVVVKITVERVKVLYRYRKKGENAVEHFLLGAGNDRQADITAVVVIDGQQKRTSTARNCNDVRPRLLLGSIDVLEKNYKTSGAVVDCADIYNRPEDLTRPTIDTDVWSFTTRIEDPVAKPSIVYQVLVLDDLIPRDDKRVDVAAGDERRNQIFEYILATDTIVGADKTERVGPGVHKVMSKGDKSSAQSAALTVKIERLPRPTESGGLKSAYPGPGGL